MLQWGWVYLCGLFCQASQDEAVKQKEALSSEIGCLRGDLQQVREDRDRQLAQVQTLTAEVDKYKERTGKSLAELDSLTSKSNELEVHFFIYCLNSNHWLFYQ